MTASNARNPNPAARKSTTGQLVATERLHTLGQLVAGVIHELNNPLTIVGTNLHVLAEYVAQQQQLIDMYEAGAAADAIARYREEIDLEYLRQDLPRILGSCQEGAQRARSLVDELRRFSIAGSPEVGLVDLKGALQSTVRLVESNFRNKAKFVLDIEGCPPIMGIAGQIQQVLMNLLVNACQSIREQGTVTLRCETKGEYVIVHVDDTGAGIPADVLPRIFEPYFSTKAPTEGTGLGLPISKRICEKHGGSLTVKSEVGKGTTFTVTLRIEGAPGLTDDPSSPYDL